jgi:hypothetical protein
MLLGHCLQPLSDNGQSRYVVSFGGGRPSTESDRRNFVFVLDVMTMTWFKCYIPDEESGYSTGFRAVDHLIQFRCRFSVVSLSSGPELGLQCGQSSSEHRSEWKLPDSSDASAINYLREYRQQYQSGTIQQSSSVLNSTFIDIRRQQSHFLLYGGYCAQRRVFSGEICIVTCSTHRGDDDGDGFVDDKLFAFKWSISTPRIAGAAPAARFACATVLVPFSSEAGGIRMFVVGGVGHGENFHNVHSLVLNDLKTMQWEAVKQSMRSPDVRHGHSLSAIRLGRNDILSGSPTDTGVVLIGGINSQGSSVHDVWLMRVLSTPNSSTVNGTISTTSTISSAVNVVWDLVRTSGIAKSVGCSRHEAVCIDNRVFIFGGSDEQDSAAGEEKFKELEPLVYCLDTTTEYKNGWNWGCGPGVQRKFVGQDLNSSQPHPCVATISSSASVYDSVSQYSDNQGMYEPRVDNMIRLPSASLAPDMLQLLVSSQQREVMEALFPSGWRDVCYFPSEDVISLGADVTFILSAESCIIPEEECGPRTDLADLLRPIRSVLFRAHSCIIQSRCDVLRAMLSSDMEEARCKVIHISDCAPRVFFSLLRFLYTDTLKVDPNDVSELLILAQQYNLRRLVLLCESLLSLEISADASLDMLGFAMWMNLPTLKTVAMSTLLRGGGRDYETSFDALPVVPDVTEEVQPSESMRVDDLSSFSRTSDGQLVPHAGGGIGDDDDHKMPIKRLGPDINSADRSRRKQDCKETQTIDDNVMSQVGDSETSTGARHATGLQHDASSEITTGRSVKKVLGSIVNTAFRSVFGAGTSTQAQSSSAAGSFAPPANYVANNGWNAAVAAIATVADVETDADTDITESDSSVDGTPGIPAQLKESSAVRRAYLARLTNIPHPSEALARLLGGDGLQVTDEACGCAPMDCDAGLFAQESASGIEENTELSPEAVQALRDACVKERHIYFMEYPQLNTHCVEDLGHQSRPWAFYEAPTSS